MTLFKVQWPQLLSTAIAMVGVLGCATSIPGEGVSNTPEDKSDSSTDAGVEVPPEPMFCDDNLGDQESDLAKAMELCDGSLLSIAVSSESPTQLGTFASYGETYVPKAGAAMATIATGGIQTQVDKDDGEMGGSQAHPMPQGTPGNGCGRADPSRVQDMVKVVLQLRAPSGANGFSFDFNFMSAEFPEFLCTEYDDTFLAVLDSAGLDGNISFDENGNVISINTGFFDVCNPGNASSCQGAQELAGTGFDGRGGTGWLTTTAPITEGEEFSLTFYLFDEGDPDLTSQVLLDNFQWIGEDVGDDPVTID